MMLLRTWLTLARHPETASAATDEARRIIHADALALEARVRSRGIRLHAVDDPAWFRDKIEKEAERLRAVGAELPLLSAHADLLTRHLTAENFLAIVATKSRRLLPMPLLATGTISTYPRSTPRELLATQRLYCDYPDVDAPYKAVVVEGDDPALDEADSYAHGGTLWVREFDQNNGLGGMLARLVVAIAWLRFGRTVIGTIVAGKRHEDLMSVPRVIGRALCDGLDTRICMFRLADILAAAERTDRRPVDIAAT